jgi:hypothetical protein
MNTRIQFLQAVHADRLARLHAEAHQARLARSARPVEHLTPAGSR